VHPQPEDGAQVPDLSTTSVVIPTLNEAENLPGIFAVLPKTIVELIIVDGLSTDGTVDVAKELWPSAQIVLETKRGKGSALLAGFEAAEGKFVVAIDADGSTRPEEITLFVQALQDGADFVTGSRFIKGAGSDDLTPIRKFGSWGISVAANIMFGSKYTDINYGFNGFRRDCLEQLNLHCQGFEIEALMNVKAQQAGLKIVEVPCFERARVHGKSNLHPVKDGSRILRTMIAEWIRPQ
jgi:glycosyltransferase involved in cell wall biosynthesis